MQFVEISPVLDAERYKAVLPGLRSSLPPGAYSFASNPDHYDFYGSRCVKDLKLNEIRLVDVGEVNVEIEFDPNTWKHDGGLIVRYSAAIDLCVTVNDEVLAGPRKLGSVILDELLPDQHGVRHEIAFHGGSVVVISADLRAIWAVASE